MINSQNIRDTLKNSPRLWFVATTDILQHIGGIRHGVSIEKTSIVDYEQMRAKITTRHEEEGYSQTTTEYYKDGGKRTVITSNIPELNQESFTDIPADEYRQLFSDNGVLRPVIDDTLQETTGSSTPPGTFTFRLAPATAANSEEAPTHAHVIFTLCSDDTIKINSLATALLNPQDGSLAVTETETIVHLYEGNDLVF